MGNSKKVRILFIESGSLFGYSGFTQQFLMEARAIKANKLDITVVAFESLRDIARKRSRMYKAVFWKSKISYLIIPSWFRQNAILETLFNTINTVLLGVIAALTRANVIHAHDRVSAYYAVRLKAIFNLKVIYDMHGINIEESIYARKLKADSALCNRLRTIEESIVNKADAIFCVSERMKRYVSEKYRVSPWKFLITPTGVDTDLFSYSGRTRDKMVERLHLNKKFVVLFMGHMQEWQVNDYFGALFKAFRNKMENAHFLILTDKKNVFRELFKDIGVHGDHYSIFSVTHEVVPEYAAAGDVGILLRDVSIVNEVAAPAKFGEYLALGMPVIVTRGIGDTEEFVKKHRVGSVIDGFSQDSITTGVDELLDLVRNDGTKLPERCSRVAKDLLSVSVAIKTFLSTYHTLLS